MPSRVPHTGKLADSHHHHNPQALGPFPVRTPALRAQAHLPPLDMCFARTTVQKLPRPGSESDPTVSDGLVSGVGRAGGWQAAPC